MCQDHENRIKSIERIKDKAEEALQGVGARAIDIVNLKEDNQENKANIKELFKGNNSMEKSVTRLEANFDNFTKELVFFREDLSQKIGSVADSFNRFTVQYSQQQTEEKKSGKTDDDGIISAITKLKPVQFLILVIVIALVLTGQFVIFTNKIADNAEKITINPHVKL
jgi:predicted nuclease with TOPRIM domain